MSEKPNNRRGGDGSGDEAASVPVVFSVATTPTREDEWIQEGTNKKKRKKTLMAKDSPTSVVGASLNNEETPLWVDSQGKPARQREMKEAVDEAFKDFGFFDDTSEEGEVQDTKQGIDWMIPDETEDHRKVGFSRLSLPEYPEKSNQEDTLSSLEASSPSDPPSVVPMTALRMQQRHVKPGAFRMYPTTNNGEGERIDDEEDVGSTHARSDSSTPAQQESTDSTQILLEARVVNEPDPEIYEAKLVDEEANRLRRKRQLLLVAALLVVVALVIGVSVGLTWPSPTLPTPAPTVPMIPISDLIDEFRSSLPMETIAAIDTESTPQQRAFQWVSEHPPIPDVDPLSRMAQMFALVTFYHATTDGSNSQTHNTGWLDHSVRECDWFGCSCNQDTSMVKSLELPSKWLVGMIPLEISLLSPSLELLDLSINTLTGPVPSELGKLSRLTNLTLRTNQFNGTIPTELGDLGNLVDLQLWDNELTGSIPTELGRLSKLDKLALSQNQLNGMIPTELGDLVNLEEVYLHSNALTGMVPTEVGKLSKLLQLYLNSNELTGRISTELGRLSHVLSLALYENHLTGPIPSEVGLLTALTGLWLYESNLTGPIPTEIGTLSALSFLALNSNRFLSGWIPTEVGLLTDLQQLYFNNNSLTGPIPTEISMLSALSSLALNSNRLSGRIPTEVGLLTDLQYLYLYNNRLTGFIPSEIGMLAALNYLKLNANSLKGTIPTEMGLLSDLRYVWLYNNSLTGPIPTEVGMLAALLDLSLNGNGLNGTIPTEVGLLTDVEDLWLHGNELSGPIPTEVSFLANMTRLYLYDNNLTGPIPTEVGLLTDIQQLFLDTNALIGPIPTEIVCT